MKYEKSCGAIIYFKENGQYHFLIIKHTNGMHWGFSKGHVEGDETEAQTALREIEEETGLKVRLIDNFRQTTEYSPKNGVMKEVIYFIAEAVSKDILCQKGEVEEFRWVDYKEGYNLLTHESSKLLLKAAYDFLLNMNV